MLDRTAKMNSCVSFISYFRLLVFSILVTLIAWISFHFFPSCPSCLAKCQQRLCNISSAKVTKNKKWNERNNNSSPHWNHVLDKPDRKQKKRDPKLTQAFSPKKITFKRLQHAHHHGIPQTAIHEFVFRKLAIFIYIKKFERHSGILTRIKFRFFIFFFFSI